MKRQKQRRDDNGYKKLFDKNSDDSGEETELFTRKMNYQEPPTMEKVVAEGDTLRAISIRYQCSVAELKRLNHIHNDNEIFAKRTIKVPDRPISAILAGVHYSGRNSPQERTGTTKGIDTDLLETRINSALLNKPGCSKDVSANSFNDIIFNSSIANKTCDINNEVEDISDEEVNLIPKPIVVVPPVVVTKFSCSGADADISWIALIVCVVIIILAVPLIYVFYVAEHPEQFHHHHNNHNS